MWTFKHLFLLSLLIAVVLFIGRSIIYTKDYKTSSLLKEIVQFLNTFDDTVKNAERLAIEDPFEELVTQLKVEHEKIDRINKEIDAFEDIDSTPADPVDFMYSILENLEAITKQVQEYETQYKLIVKGQKKSMNTLHQEYKTSFEGLDTAFDDKSLNELQRVGIFLNEPSETFTDNMINIQLKLLEEKLTNLAEKFVELENLQQQQDKTSATTDEKTIAKEIMDNISRDEQFYRCVMPKIGLKWKMLEEVVEKIGEHQTEVKTRYRKLGDELNHDLAEARERIKALNTPQKTEL